MLFKWILCVTLFAFSSQTWCDQLIIEPEMGRAPILNFIREANQSINLVMYGFTDETLFAALAKQKNNGKTLRIILEETPYKTQNQNKKIIKKLNDEQIDNFFYPLWIINN